MAESDRNNHIAPEDLSAYADGEMLTPEERERIARHLESCEVCRQELAELSAVQQLLTELPEPETPRSFRLSPEDVEDGNQGPAPAPIQPWLLRHQSAFRVAAMAAAVLLALVVTVDLLPGGSGDDEDAALDTLSDSGDSGQEFAREDADRPESAGDAEQEDAAEPEAGTDSVTDEADDEAAQDDGGADMGADEDAAEPATGEEEQEEEAVQEEAPPEEEDAATSGSAGDDTAGDGSADQDVAQEAVPEETDEEEKGAASEGGEAAPPETEEAPMDGDDGDAEIASEPDSPGAEEEVRAQEPSEAEDDGLSTLRVIAIILAVITVALASAGFLIPRWWRSSSRS